MPSNGAGPISWPPSRPTSNSRRDVTGIGGAAHRGTAEPGLHSLHRRDRQWWRPHGLFELNGRGDGRLAIEAGLGGRIIESYPDGVQFEVGHVQVWDPPDRLAFSWRAASFPPGRETEVHVRFEHLGWDGIPQEHAARHGFPLLPFQQRLAQWWQALLDSLATASTT
jgi:uncharacterized protein YndB with AHSA1/START domain